MSLLMQMLAPSAQRTEKMKRSSLGLGWAVSVACSLMLLSGCDKLKAVDDLMAQTASNTAEIDSLKRSLADSRKETDALRSQVIGMYDRVAATPTIFRWLDDQRLRCPLQPHFRPRAKQRALSRRDAGSLRVQQMYGWQGHLPWVAVDCRASGSCVSPCGCFGAPGMSRSGPWHRHGGATVGHKQTSG